LFNIEIRFRVKTIDERGKVIGGHKRDCKDRQGRYVGYKNGLNLNMDLVKCKKWAMGNIDLRTQKLVEQRIKLFQINKQ